MSIFVLCYGTRNYRIQHNKPKIINIERSKEHFEPFIEMIKSFKQKGLKELLEKGKTNKLPQERLDRIRKLLFIIHNAHQLEDVNTPSSRLHKLKAPPYAGWHSVDVTGNYRIVFQFTNGSAYDIDYADTH